MINQKSANIQERKVLRNGVVLYTIASDSSDYTYFVTVTNGKIDEATHQDCKGFHFCGKCFHVKDIYAMEGEIQAERKMASLPQLLRCDSRREDTSHCSGTQG
jgi:hypothetical protein